MNGFVLPCVVCKVCGADYVQIYSHQLYGLFIFFRHYNSRCVVDKEVLWLNPEEGKLHKLENSKCLR